MTDCPSCGRYVGPYDACPHCGATLSGRTAVRVLKVGALLLALGGLALLWALATHTAVPTVEIGQANAMMNLAYVRVEGLVTRSPSYDPDSDYLSFWLTDDTGELRVTAYRNETRELLDQGRTPALGDRVSVQGTLRIREDLVALTINVPEHLAIYRDEPVDRSAGEITAEDAFARVRVRGQVRAKRVAYPGLTLIGLRDRTGEIDLAVTEVITTLTGDLPAMTVGQMVEVVAAVSLYKDTPQLSLAHAADLTLLDHDLIVAPVLDMGQIDPAQIDRWVSVSGRVTDVSPFSAGVKYTLDDGTGQVILLLWQNLYDQLTDPGALNVGAELSVQGSVAEYRGEMEMVPELALDLQVLAPAPTVASPQAGLPPELAIGDLGTERLGELVIVQGVVDDASSFSKGFRFKLDDGTGQVTLLTWLDVYDGIVGQEGLRAGASVQVLGELEQFEEEMQIVPASSDDVLILAAGDRLAPAREIGSLTLDDAGSWVTVEGQVVRAQVFNGGLRVTLDDGSGSGLLLLWQNVLERLPEGARSPAVGSRLRATGRVEDFQGTLEIVPVFPFDVETVVAPTATLQPTVTPTPPILPIGALDASWSGEVVTVTGQVVDAASFAQGFKFTLDDGTGQVVLLTWHNVYDGCADAPQLNVGANVRVNGEIGQFEGVLQIEPQRGTDVKVMAQGDAFAPERKIGAIGDTIGQRVTVSGQVKRTENTDGGIRVYVGDDSGETLVYIWSNVLERIPNHEALATSGTQVRITGMVQEYRGELEIVPALPFDVEVLE